MRAFLRKLLLSRRHLNKSFPNETGLSGFAGRVAKFMAVNQRAFVDSQARYPVVPCRPMLPGNYAVTGIELLV